MKSVTEFPNHILVRGIDAKTALTAEGKTPEEIQAGLGAAFKYEGDRLKHFLNALEVAARNAEGLARVMVMSLNEGEKAPAKALQVETLCYVPEFRIVFNPNAPQKHEVRGGRGGKGRQGRGGQGGGPRESPWGLSPEQKAAKKGAGKGAKGTGGGGKKV